MRIASFLADEKGESHKYFDTGEDCISYIENEIDNLDAMVPAITTFIIPGGNLLVSYCHIARCICRRTERTVLRLNSTEKLPDLVYIFLNRLSDYLFLLSRVISHDVNNEELEWNI
jgi:cob(I)alamin adenosyltransferase